MYTRTEWQSGVNGELSAKFAYFTRTYESFTAAALHFTVFGCIADPPSSSLCWCCCYFVADLSAIMSAGFGVGVYVRARMRLRAFTAVRKFVAFRRVFKVILALKRDVELNCPFEMWTL